MKKTIIKQHIEFLQSTTNSNSKVTQKLIEEYKLKLKILNKCKKTFYSKIFLKELKKEVSKTKGFTRSGKGWKAQIYFNKKSHYLGTFKTKLEASKAYQKKLKEKKHGKTKQDLYRRTRR